MSPTYHRPLPEGGSYGWMICASLVLHLFPDICVPKYLNHLLSMFVDFSDFLFFQSVSGSSNIQEDHSEKQCQEEEDV